MHHAVLPLTGEQVRDLLAVLGAVRLPDSLRGVVKHLAKAPPPAPPDLPAEHSSAYFINASGEYEYYR